MRFSLLHASFHSNETVQFFLDRWLGSARRPDRIQYVLACDSDDKILFSTGANLVKRSSGDGNQSVSTAVRNWNHAATLADGDILFVIADDLIPPRNWDLALENLVSGHAPLENAWALKITDSEHPHDTLLRHPVLSRKFFQEYGLFDPSFSGVYCDDDFSLRAFWKSYIIDGRSVIFDHNRAQANGKPQLSQSQRIINSQDEAIRGKAAFMSLWPKNYRNMKIRLVEPSTPPKVARMKNQLLKLSAFLESTNYRVRRLRGIRLGRKLLRNLGRALQDSYER